MQECTVCNNKQLRGIYLFNLFICETCHEQMVRTDPEDPDYRYFVEKLKRIHQQPSHRRMKSI